MCRKVALALAIFFLVQGYVARGAEVKGVVVSYTTRKPLAGVTVSVRPGVKRVYTGADGSYKIGGLQPNRYTLEFDLVSYMLRPERRNIAIKANTDELDCDVILKPEDISGREAARAAATAFSEEVKRDGGDKVAYVRQWQRLRNGTLSFEEKVAFAEALREDGKAMEYLPLREYLDAQKSDLRAFSDRLRATLAEGKSLPDTDLVKKLGPDLTADIVLFQLRTADVDAGRKFEVADDIAAEWKGLAPASVLEANFITSQGNATRPP